MDEIEATALPKVRTYLTPSEIDKLIDVAKKERNARRNCCMILLMFRHGLRIGEALALQPPQIDFDDKTIHIKRLKNGISNGHILEDDELKLLKSWMKERDNILKNKNMTSDILFCTSSGGQISAAKFRFWFPRIGKKAGLTFHVHPHMLRHSCGYFLANQGNDTRLIQSYLGHRSIEQTVRYTEVNPARYRNLFSGCKRSSW